MLGCFLTKIDAAGATLELRVRVPDTERDSARSKLVAALAQRFAESGPDAKGEGPASFS